MMLERGLGGRADLAGARKLYEEAFRGDVSAKVLLGAMYESANGVAADAAQAQRLYDEAIALQAGYMGGDRPGAIAILGWMYLWGEPLKDYARSRRWYLRSIEAGFAGNAFTNLGLIHEQGGDGVPRDLAEAERWYAKGAQAGDKDSIEALQRLRRAK